MTDPAPPLSPPPPKVFSRIITTPPAPPWRQRQMAILEAKQSAPLPISEVTFQIRRIGPWTSQAGRYGAFYVRTADFTQSFSTEVRLDNQILRVRMNHPSEQQGRSTRLAIIGGAGAVVLVALVAGLSAAGAQRARLSDLLEASEHQASSRLRVAQNIQRRWREATALEAVSRGDTPAAQVAADIGWVASRRVSGSRIQALHWEPAALAVEAVGSTPPIEAWDRRLIRSERPVRPGVWAWASERAPTITPATRSPVTSQLK